MSIVPSPLDPPEQRTNDPRQQILNRLAQLKQQKALLQQQKPLDYHNFLPTQLQTNLHDNPDLTDSRISALDTLGDRANQTARTLAQNRASHRLMVEQRTDMRREQRMLNNAPGNNGLHINGKKYVPWGGERGKILKYGERFIGTPYVWGGNNLRRGVDCSGLVQQVYGHFGINLPRVAAQQAMTGHHAPINKLRPGDLVAWGSPAHHISIYVGNGKILEAPRTGLNVRIRKLGSWSEDRTAYGVRLQLHPRRR